VESKLKRRQSQPRLQPQKLQEMQTSPRMINLRQRKQQLQQKKQQKNKRSRIVFVSAKKKRLRKMPLSKTLTIPVLTNSVNSS